MDLKFTYRFDVTALKPPQGGALDFQQAAAALERGDAARARAICDQILLAGPKHRPAINLLGLIAMQCGDAAAALQWFDKAVSLEPSDAAAYCNKAAALRQLQEWEAALACYDQAIGLKQDFAAAHNDRGMILADLGRLHAARDSIDQAIALNPTYALAHHQRGLVSHALGVYEAALDSFERAIALNSRFPAAHHARGITLCRLARYNEALASLDVAIAMKNDPEAHYNRGLVLSALSRWDAALNSYNQAVALKPDYAIAHLNRGNALRHLGNLDAAVESYDRALQAQGDLPYVFGQRQHVKMLQCDWEAADASIAKIAEGVRRGVHICPPLAFLALSDCAALQRQCAALWMRAQCPPDLSLGEIPKHVPHDKIRIGYFSPDFREHPVAALTTELFETHDRSRFELSAFSFGPDTQDAMRARLRRAFDRFIDVRDRTDREVALLARGMELDIAVDLAGFTENCRPQVFALRAAPLQISYLGYLGTMAAPYMDYLIADATIVPSEYRQYYDENILYLKSYQANDSQRRIADKTFSREELHLPASGFVFCCFNANYKLLPRTFSAWMRVLHRVAGSVLLLHADNDTVERNLRHQAATRGIHPERLVFARRLPAPEYLARFRAADLFLDTLPYNAGTTASDALWAGLPVLTCAGEGFASRVAASLLMAVGLPELVAATEEEYVETAVSLATNPQRMSTLRQLLSNRGSARLFDIRAFTQNLEAGYQELCRRHQAGLPPADIRV